MRLKTKIALPWFFIVVFAIGSLGFWSASIIQRNLDEESHTFLKTILSSYVSEVLQQRQDILEANNLQDVPSYVQQYQQSAMQAAGEINFFWSGWIMAHDRRGKLIFTTGADERIPEQFRQRNQSVLLNLAHGEFAQGFIADKQFFLSTYYQPWGWYLTAVVDQAPLHQSVREVRMATLFWIAGVIVVSIAFLAWVTHFVLISPINSLRRAAAQISSGNYVDRVNVESADDLGDLARDIEAMSIRIQEKERQLQDTNDQLELRVQERTRQLFIRNEELDQSQARLQWALRRNQLLAETAAQLLQSDAPQALIEELCCRVMEFVDCQVFFNFLDDSKQGKLHLNAFGGIGDQQAKQIEWLEYGTAVCGYVAQTRCPMVCEDIQDRDDALTSLVKSFGIQAYCCHPLMVGDRLVGTLSFGRRSASSFDQEEIELMAQVGNLVAVAMNRITIESRLRESESRFKTFAELAPVGIVISDEQENTLYANPNFTYLFGYTMEDMPAVEQWWERAYPDAAFREEVRRQWQDAVGQARRTGSEITPMEHPVTCKDGTLRHIEFRMSITAELNVVVFSDVTKRKKAEAAHEKLQAQLLQAQKMESVGRLAGGVAHDFNNMLSVILGNAELALSRVNTEKEMEDSMRASLQDSLQEIHQAARRSAEITRQLLAFARRQNIEPQVLDLNETVEKMLNMLRRLIGEDIDLLWKPGSGLWLVKIDPSQLDQILANLCVNARDAITDVGRITIETDNVRFDAEYCADHPGFVVGEYVLLAVSDDGCGMDRETREKIFEPFYTTKDASTGTGLGLAMIYGIVKQNQGFINVYSELERGTTFRIYFPRHAEEAASLQQQVVEEIPLGAGETVLVVEDEAAILKLTRKILENQGYKVLQATNPIEAMARVKELAGEVDLLITDVVMPEMNGRDLAEKLQADYPHLKVLFMSGYTANVIAHHGVLDEGVQFIQKPFSGRDLAEKILEVMD